MTGITLIEHYIESPAELFTFLISNIAWDERMTARKTASYGVAYNYSQIHYPYLDLLPELVAINKMLQPVVGFESNNCLINYYPDGKSKMGYHSDQTDILEDGTGIAIVSLGATRQLKFRKIAANDEVVSFDLPAGSLVYMTQAIQAAWQHAIPASDTMEGRISLTFRRLI